MVVVVAPGRISGRAILCLGEAADADQPRLRSLLALMDGSRDRPARLELLIA
jgi:hypothetical protein